MKAQYPEVKERRDDIAQVVKREEENFLNVLEKQLPKVEEMFGKLSNKKDNAPYFYRKRAGIRLL